MRREQGVHRSKLIYGDLMRKMQVAGSGEDNERRVVSGGGGGDGGVKE
jgi:hypothetical protein